MNKFFLSCFCVLILIPLVSCNKTEEQADPFKPFIVLKGTNPAWSELGKPYTDEGAEAFDITADRDTINISTRLEVVENVDINTIGAYQVSFNVKDDAGNEAIEVVRTVYVNQFK